MNSFFGSIFIDRHKLRENGINYPIKLEYYKTIHRTKENIQKYGIKIIKTEYIKDKINTEVKRISNVTKNEKVIESLLQILKKYEVTPIVCNDIIDEIFKQQIYKYVIN